MEDNQIVINDKFELSKNTGKNKKLLLKIIYLLVALIVVIPITYFGFTIYSNNAEKTYISNAKKYIVAVNNGREATNEIGMELVRNLVLTNFEYSNYYLDSDSAIEDAMDKSEAYISKANMSLNEMRKLKKKLSDVPLVLKFNNKVKAISENVLNVNDAFIDIYNITVMATPYNISSDWEDFAEEGDLINNKIDSELRKLKKELNSN